MAKKPNQDGKELAKDGILIAGNLAAIVLALLSPYIGAAFAGTVETAKFAREYSNRKSARRAARAIEMERQLEKRLQGAKVEADEAKLDLLIEVAKKALEDDEARKDAIYAAVLEWIARESPNSARVRILSDAVRQLSYVELFCCLHEAHERHARKVCEADGISENLYRKRLAAVGFGTDGVIMIGQTTPFSAVLKKYVNLDELEPPNALAKNPERWV